MLPDTELYILIQIVLVSPLEYESIQQAIIIFTLF